MHNPVERGGPCQILVEDLFTMINKRRKMLRLEPIENRAIASRCTLRFNLGKQRGVDFNNKQIRVAATDIPVLRDMINEQFGVNFENELNTLCAKSQAKPASRMITTPATEPEVEAETMVTTHKSGFGNKLKRLFGGR